MFTELEIGIIRDSLEALFVAFVVSAFFTPLMINFMYRFRQTSEIKASKAGIDGKSNALFRKIMNVQETNGTPNMGGVMILFVVPIVSYLLLPLTPIMKVLLFGFVLFGIWGLLDVLFTNSIKGNPELIEKQERFEWRMGKLGVAVLLNCIVTYCLYKTGYLTDIVIWNDLSLVFMPILIPVIAVVGQFAIYASELTDGADGLMVGIMGVIFAALGIVTYISGATEFLPFIFIVLGCLGVNLYFNIPPARFWNGGPGAMPLGFAAFFISLVTNNLIPYFIISIMTWIILASSIIQILSVKFFKRRVFKIAPIHHHFQALGWPMYKVVMRFWLYTVFSSLIGILVSLYLM